jgi:hypothetical protein
MKLQHANPELARAFGWIVGRFQNPAEVPVKTFHGWMTLDSTGGKTPAEAIA